VLAAASHARCPRSQTRICKRRHPLSRRRKRVTRLCPHRSWWLQERGRERGQRHGVEAPNHSNALVPSRRRLCMLARVCDAAHGSRYSLPPPPPPPPVVVGPPPVVLPAQVGEGWKRDDAEEAVRLGDSAVGAACAARCDTAGSDPWAASPHPRSSHRPAALIACHA